MYPSEMGNYNTPYGQINYSAAGFVQDHLIYWDDYTFTLQLRNVANADFY